MIKIQTATTPATFTESVAGEEKEVSPPEALKKISRDNQGCFFFIFLRQ